MEASAPGNCSDQLERGEGFSMYIQVSRVWWFSESVPGPAASPSQGNVLVLAIQILRLHPTPDLQESGILEVGPANLCFNRPSA